MKTSVIDVHDMLSVLSVPGVEAQIGAVPEPGVPDDPRFRPLDV